MCIRDRFWSARVAGPHVRPNHLARASTAKQTSVDGCSNDTDDAAGVLGSGGRRAAVALRGHRSLDGGDRLVIPGAIATPCVAPTNGEEQDRKHHQPTNGVKHGTLLEVGYSQPPTVKAVNDVRFGDRVQSTHGPPEAARTSPPARPGGRLLTSSGASTLAVVGADQDEHLVLGAVAADHDARITVAVSGAGRALAGRIVLGARARLADPS